MQENTKIIVKFILININCRNIAFSFMYANFAQKGIRR